MAAIYSLIQSIYIHQTHDTVYISLHRMPLSLTRISSSLFLTPPSLHPSIYPSLSHSLFQLIHLSPPHFWDLAQMPEISDSVSLTMFPVLSHPLSPSSDRVKHLSPFVPYTLFYYWKSYNTDCLVTQNALVGHHDTNVDSWAHPQV